MKLGKIIGIMVSVLILGGCGKYGVQGHINHLIGDWAPVNLPQGCDVSRIAGEEGSGVIILCKDGRVFH